MKTTQIIAAVSLALGLTAGALAAQPVFEPDNTPFEGVYGQVDQAPSRAQVKADLLQAKGQGLQTFGEQDNTPYAPVLAGNSPTREQIKREIAEAGGPQIAFGEDTNVAMHVNGGVRMNMTRHLAAG